MIKFSVAIPAYKSKHLKECISSVLAQTYTNFELIIINDNSPEPVREIVKSFVDDRIIYSENLTNVGALNVVDNWNKCLEQASGSYFVLLGDDDKLGHRYLEVFAELISKYPTLDVYHCRSLIINDKSEVVNITRNNCEFEDIYDFVLNCITGRNQQFISDFVYEVSALKKRNGFFKLPLAWGTDYLSAYLACGKKGIASSNNAVLLYRIHGANITALGNLDSKWEAYKILHQQTKSLMDVVENDKELILKRKLVLEALERKWVVEKKSIVMQIIGKRKLNGILHVIKRKRDFDMTTSNIIAVFFEQLLSKLLNKSTV